MSSSQICDGSTGNVICNPAPAAAQLPYGLAKHTKTPELEHERGQRQQLGSASCTRQKTRTGENQDFAQPAEAPANLSGQTPTSSVVSAGSVMASSHPLLLHQPVDGGPVLDSHLNPIPCSAAMPTAAPPDSHGGLQDQASQASSAPLSSPDLHVQGTGTGGDKGAAPGHSPSGNPGLPKNHQDQGDFIITRRNREDAHM
jgi:hypothetical protein